MDSDLNLLSDRAFFKEGELDFQRLGIEAVKAGFIVATVVCLGEEFLPSGFFDNRARGGHFDFRNQCHSRLQLQW